MSKNVQREAIVYPRRSRRSVGMTPVGESLTKQEFRDECDINVIMDKYRNTGILPSFGASGPPQFGDFSEIGDYQSCLNRVMDAQSKFASLPAEVRDHFANDPALLIEACSDPSRLKELEELGLVEPQGAEVAPGAQKAAPPEPGSSDPQNTGPT